MKNFEHECNGKINELPSEEATATCDNCNCNEDVTEPAGDCSCHVN